MMGPFEGGDPWHYSLREMAEAEGWTFAQPQQKRKTNGASGQGKPKQNKAGTKLSKKLRRR